MKILFLTASAGEGHNSICKAMTASLKKYYPDVESQTYDIYKEESAVRHHLLNKTYYNLCKSFLRLSNNSFQKVRNTDYTKKKNLLVSYFVKAAIKNIQKKLTAEKPDVIYCAHTFAAIAVATLRKSNFKPAVDALVYSVVSDFDVAPCTECLTEVDYVFVPHIDLVTDLENKGFKKDQIILANIPISESFYGQNLEVESELHKPFTLFMMSGAKSYTNMYKVLKYLISSKKEEDDYKIIVINGKNEKLKSQIDKLIKKYNIDYIENLGFVDDISEYMNKSDIVFSKLGGITVTETMARMLPIIAPKNLPLQENNNSDFLSSHHVCIQLEKDKDLGECLHNILQTPSLYKSMKVATREFQNPSNMKIICDHIIKTAKS